VPVSVDTYKSTVAARAVELGAVMVNDVWGLQKDPGMADAVAAAEAAVVIMHNLVERVRQSTSWISGNSLHVHSRSQRRPAMRHHASSLISASHLPKAHARTPK
jgi:dihydropteroate synthase